MKVEYKGVVKKIYSSGIVESDMGFKFPFSRANIGDVMIDVDGNRRIVSKAEYAKEYRSKVKTIKPKKEEKEGDNG